MKAVFIRFVIVFTMLNMVTLDQFAKLPLFFTHFIEHSKKDHSITLTDFLRMHYTGKDINDNDDEKDKQLPFKNINAQSIQHQYMPVARFEFEPLKTAYFPPKEVKMSGHREYILQGASTDLFRPPRV